MCPFMHVYMCKLSDNMCVCAKCEHVCTCMHVGELSVTLCMHICVGAKCDHECACQHNACVHAVHLC